MVPPAGLGFINGTGLGAKYDGDFSLSLEQAQRLIETIRPDYRNYLKVRIFTGMRLSMARAASNFAMSSATDLRRLA